MIILRCLKLNIVIIMALSITLPLMSSMPSKKNSQFLSNNELYELTNNSSESYVYCDKTHSKIVDFIAEVSLLDKDHSSPLWQLKKHIEDGFVIGRKEYILDALTHADMIINKSFSSEVIEYLQEMLHTLLDQLIIGQLDLTPSQINNQAEKRSSIDLTIPVTISSEIVSTVTPEVIPATVSPIIPEAISDEFNDLITDESSRTKTISVKSKVKFLKNVKFKEHAKFEHYVSFHGNVKFRQNVEIDGILSATDETISGTLSVNEAAIESLDVGCDLTVGCNINLNNSINPAIGNVLKDGASFIHNFGNDNTFIGVDAGNFSMSGGANTGAGAFVLESNINGSLNTASGLAALAGNQTGSVNTSCGAISLVNNTLGNANTAIGFISMVSNTTGNANTACGLASLRSNVIGNANTAIGIGALHFSTGDRNIGLGAHAGHSLTIGNDNVYIAADGASSESGIIRIGTDSTHVDTYIQGIYNTAVSSGLPVQIDVSGHLGTMPSTQTVKKNIADMSVESEGIYNLRPVTFSYKSDVNNTLEYGLLAEEVEKIFPSLIAYDRDGKPFSVRYQSLPILMLNEMQKQHALIQALIKRIAMLEKARIN